MKKNDEKKTTKRDSLSVVVHNIRSPVYTLKEYLKAFSLGDLGELNEDQKKYIDVCLENVKVIDYIISGLVDVMEIEEDRYQLEKKKVNIVKTLKEAVERNTILAKASNTKISTTLPEEPIFVLTDPVKINEVLDAFLGNAIKYKNPVEGKIEISIEEKESSVLCSVRDNGIGIPEEEKERVFDKFYRTERAMSIDPKSLGLQLYINKIVIEHSGGQVWVENNKEEGVTFYFTLPIYKKE